ncbi:hypothetical protein PENTCL1PPCAC_4100, partial [Pristionchus entomophagus]
GSCKHTLFYNSIEPVSIDPSSEIAEGFINLISNHIPTDVNNEIGSFLFDRYLFSNAAYDLLISQPSFLVLFWLGIILSLLSIVGAVLVIFPCTRNWNTKKLSSHAMSMTGTVLAVLSLVFILIGTALYLIPIFYPYPHQYSIKSEISSIKDNIGIFLNTGDQNGCFARDAFDPILTQTKALPEKVIVDFENDTGLEDAASVNYTIFGSALTDSTVQLDKIITDLETAAQVDAIIKDQKALDEVNDAITAYQTIKQLISTWGLPNDLNSYGKQVLTFQTNIEQIIRNTVNPASNTATSNINDVYYSVMRTIDGVRNAMGMTGVLIENVGNQMNHATDNLETEYEGSDDWLRLMKDVLVILLLFAAISAIMAIVFGSLYLTKKSMEPSGKSSCVLFTFGFIVLVLTSLVIAPTLFIMTYGYSAQASCQPFFYDTNLKGLQTMGHRLPTFPIPAMNGGSVNTTFADVMLTCMRQSDTTFFGAAANGHLVIYQDVMETALNYTQVFNQFKQSMNSTTIQPINKLDHDNIWNATYIITAPHDLSRANAVAAATISPIVQEIAKWQNDIQPTIMGIRRVCTDTDGLLDEYSIKSKINQETESSLRTINTAMGNAANNLYTSLYHSGEPCSKLTQSYADAGDLGCKGTPIVWEGQGLWPAASLAGIFFVPLALSLLCIGNAFRHGKQLAVKPVTAASPPLPDAHSQKVAVPAARAEAATVAAPVVPIRVASKNELQWQPAPQGYIPPVQQQQSIQPQFVDPLSFPAAPPTTGAVAYRGGPLPSGYYAGHPPAGYP